MRYWIEPHDSNDFLHFKSTIFNDNIQFASGYCFIVNVTSMICCHRIRSFMKIIAINSGINVFLFIADRGVTNPLRHPFAFYTLALHKVLEHKRANSINSILIHSICFNFDWSVSESNRIQSNRTVSLMGSLKTGEANVIFYIRFNQFMSYITAYCV